MIKLKVLCKYLEGREKPLANIVVCEKSINNNKLGLPYL